MQMTRKYICYQTFDFLGRRQETHEQRDAQNFLQLTEDEVKLLMQMCVDRTVEQMFLMWLLLSLDRRDIWKGLTSH